MDTNDLVREYRKKLKLSQSEFAKRFNVPISTLRKWEQKEVKPSKYFIEMIKKETSNNDLITIEADDEVFIYNTETMIVTDSKGTNIKLPYDISTLKKENLVIILSELYEEYYRSMKRFVSLCELNKKGTGKWRQLK